MGVFLAGKAALGLTSTADVRRDTMSALSHAEVSALSTTSGGLIGGETVGIRGQRLGGVTTVWFGGQEAELVTVTSTEVTVVVPHSISYEPGEVSVTVETTDGSLSDGLTWQYVVATAVDRQLEYAFRHWNDYNLTYFGDFNVWGGDCMNFVSQTLLARGWGVTDEWFNNAQEEWGDAFVHVPSFDAWLSQHPEYGAVRLDLDDRDRAKIGDVVVFDWDGDGSLDHAQVISQVRTVGDETRIAMVGHNMDTMYRDLDGALELQGGPHAQAWIWSIP